MGLPKKKEDQLFTYGDYISWPDDERWEIIEGEAYSMAPGASEEHQSVSGELYYKFRSYLEGKTCKAYYSPFDVLLPEGDEIDEDVKNIVQPDIFIVCDKSKITSKRCRGGPDLVVEILSPYTARKDIKYKKLLYEKAGVKEYWIVDPIHKTVQIYKPGENNKYGSSEIYTVEDKIKVGIFEDLEIDLASVFAGI